MSNTSVIKGYFFAAIYIITTCTSLLFLEDFSTTTHVEPLAMLWTNAILATIIMHIILLPKLHNLYSKFFRYPCNTFFMLFSVLMVVVSSFYSVAKIGTMEYLVLYFSVMGLVSSIFELIYRRKILILLCSIIFLFICGILINVLYKTSISSIILTIIGAFSGVMYSKYSQHFSESCEMSAMEILSVRYWLIIIIIPFILINNFNSSLESLSVIKDKIFITTLISVVTLIIPLYMTQKSLQYISFTSNGIINSCAPLLITLMSIIFTQKKVDMIFIYASCFIFINAVFIVFIQTSRRKN